MELLVLNENFESVYLIDTYESLIWTERYFKCGDFEIYTTASTELVALFKQDYYIWRKDTDTIMIIEDVRITSDVEDGDRLIVSGRSLESLLDRRIIWKQTTLEGNLQDGIRKLLNENIISPEDSARKIENFIFEASEDPTITSLKVEAQYTGDNLYDAIQKLCESNNIGFKISLVNHITKFSFVFSLYAGLDRSYAQNANPYVVFSPKFDNIINSNYLESRKTLKTVALVAGEGEGDARKTVTVEGESGPGKGVNRRELFVDARSISSKVDGKTLSTSQYNAQLSQKGKEDLTKNSITKSFEGEVETTQLFKYGEDFSKGDIVQIMNEYGVESRSRVIEIVLSDDVDGLTIYPTFTTVE